MSVSEAVLDGGLRVVSDRMDSVESVSIGVWALTVVLSVMHGFEGDLREKILRTNAHVLIEPASGAERPGARQDLSVFEFTPLKYDSDISSAAPSR